MEDVMSWSRTLALGLLVWPLGCVVSVSDGPNDGDFGGSGGTFDGEAGEAGDDGLGGSSGSAGESAGGTGGTGGGDLLEPTCDDEPGDDECTQCLKQYCCEEWVACDDETCADEHEAVAECVLADPAADSETLFMCISDSSSTDDGFVQSNTNDLIACTTRLADDAGFDTQCSSECYGADVFLD
jgi:hypothetical protein